MLPVDVGLPVPKLGIPTDGEVPLNGIIENTDLINKQQCPLVNDISHVPEMLFMTIQNNSGNCHRSKFICASYIHDKII